MLAYAASRQAAVQRQSSPHLMLGIIAGHIALVAVVMSVKMDLPQKIMKSPLVVELIPEKDPPPADPVTQPRTPTQPQRSVIDRPQRVVPTPLPTPDIAIPDAQPTEIPTFDKLIGPSVEPLPKADPLPPLAPVRVGARLVTAGSDLRPPYPASKIASGEEALLRLRLSIDERGRVVAVEPVGSADRAFLEAARRHLLARWRYKPATEGGRTVGSSTVITLRFQLEG
jgi:protein TonB